MTNLATVSRDYSLILRIDKYLDSDDDVAHQQDVHVVPHTEESVDSSHKNKVSTFPCSLWNISRSKNAQKTNMHLAALLSVL